VSWMSGLPRTSETTRSTAGGAIRLSAQLFASICLTLTTCLFPSWASAVSPNGETLTCEAGQTANKDLGVCQDPTCGPGTQRDPTGETRACVAITCPPGEILVVRTCLPIPPPPPRCPNGSIGQPHHLSTGVTVIECPKTLPPPPPPKVTRPTPNAGLSH
jgi:hypothetical protein